MSSVRTLSHRSSLLSLRSHIGYSLSKFKAEPRAQKQVPIFEGLRDECGDAIDQELALHDAGTEAQALVDTRDAGLNVVASRLSKAVLLITGDHEDHVLYVRYFGDKTLQAFTKPIMGAQLDAMRGWIPSLKASENKTLQELGAEVEAAVALADEAVAQKTAVEVQKKDFREVGAPASAFW